MTMNKDQIAFHLENTDMIIFNTMRERMAKLVNQVGVQQNRKRQLITDLTKHDKFKKFIKEDEELYKKLDFIEPEMKNESYFMQELYNLFKYHIVKENQRSQDAFSSILSINPEQYQKEIDECDRIIEDINCELEAIRQRIHEWGIQPREVNIDAKPN